MDSDEDGDVITIIIIITITIGMMPVITKMIIIMLLWMAMKVMILIITVVIRVMMGRMMILNTLMKDGSPTLYRGSRFELHSHQQWDLGWVSFPLANATSVHSAEQEYPRRQNKAA